MRDPVGLWFVICEASVLFEEACQSFSSSADLTRRDEEESTLLHLAAKSGDDKTLQLVLDRLPADSIWHVDGTLYAFI